VFFDSLFVFLIPGRTTEIELHSDDTSRTFLAVAGYVTFCCFFFIVVVCFALRYFAFYFRCCWLSMCGLSLDYRKLGVCARF
jgi:hypothetical protein